MDKRIAGLLGGVAALTTLGTAQAAAPATSAGGALSASSYADLLTPVPDAMAALKADDAAKQNETRTQVAQVVIVDRHHHHHHHHHHSGVGITVGVGR